MKSAKAFAPANISCIFRVHRGKTSQSTGSTGMGFTLSKGVVVKASSSKKNTLSFNKKKISIAPINKLLQYLHLKGVRLDITSAFPLGSGFGISGASTLACAFTLNKLYNLKKTKKQLAQLAHRAEVECSTGLGDIVNQYYGGFLLKAVSSHRFIVKKLPVKKATLHYRVFGPLSTKHTLKNKKKVQCIDKSAQALLSIIKRTKRSGLTLENLIECSKQFSLQSTLATSKIKKTILSIEKKQGNASMIMLGNGVFSTIPFSGSKPISLSTKKAVIL